MKLIQRLSVNAIALFFMVGATQQADAGVLNFDEQTTGAFETLTENGFILDWVGFSDQVAVSGSGGNRFLVDSNIDNVFGAEVEITRVGGGLFNLKSLDIANLLGSTVGGVSETFTGGGFRIELNNNRGESIAYTTESNTFTTVNPTGFTGISNFRLNIVSFGSNGLNFAADNIVLTPVAVPEPLTLFGLASVLVGGAFLKKRQVKSA